MVDDWDQPMFVLITVDEVLDLESINHKENTLKAYNQFKIYICNILRQLGLSHSVVKPFVE